MVMTSRTGGFIFVPHKLPAQAGFEQGLLREPRRRARVPDTISGQHVTSSSRTRSD